MCYSSDKIEDDDYIPTDNVGQIDEVITDLVLFDEEVESLRNTIKKDPVMSESVSTIFTLRNKSETWTTVPEMTSGVDLVFII